MQFLTPGDALLGPAREGAANLAFQIDLERADCLYRSGAPEAALALLTDLLPRARTDLERAAVHRVRLEVRIWSDRSRRPSRTSWPGSRSAASSSRRPRAGGRGP